MGERKEYFNTFKAAIGSYEEVKENLRLQVKKYLEESWWELNAKDFDFSILFEEIKDGNFWLIPCTSKEFKISVAIKN